MFIGHFAVGFASKRFAPRASIVVLLAAPLLSDLLWPIFLLLGWEHVRIDPGNTRFTPLDLYDFPWSHSLVTNIGWATAFASIYWLWKRDRTGAWVVWIGVLSHWVLDWITHRPDMPLYPGGHQRYGLGLWNSIAGTMLVELLMFAIGVWLYIRATKPRDRIGRYAFWAYVFLLLAAYIGDRFSAPPESSNEIAWSGVIAILILLPWAWWFDHHRIAIQTAPASATS
ncbi:MAG TPA: metal-dependent hydrolase [Candidatus Acidoferrum sp.]